MKNLEDTCISHAATHKARTEMFEFTASIEVGYIQTMVMGYLHLEAASNFSLFFFLFHFHGLKSLPSAENLLFLSRGGVLVPEPRLLVRSAVPFCFLAVTRHHHVSEQTQT